MQIQYQYIVPIFALVLFAFNTQAQSDLPTSEVEVVKQFEARLIDSKRIPIDPVSEEEIKSEKEFRYSVEDHTEELTYDAPEIKPLGYRAGDGPDTYGGYLKAGAGYPLNYLVQGGYNFFINQSVQANVFGDVRGLQDHEVEGREAMNIDFKGDLNFYTDVGLKINTYAGFATDHYTYYNPVGEIIDSSLNVDKVKYSDFTLGAKINNFEENDFGIDYSVAVEGKFLKSNFAQSDNTFNLYGNVHKKFGDKWLASLNLNSFNDIYDDGTKHKQNYFEFNPYIQFSSGNFKIKGGVLLLSSGEDAGVKPDVEIEYSLLDSRLNIFAGATGKYKINSMRSLIHENPFVDHVFDSLTLSNINDYYAGVKGSMTGINYNLRGGFRSIENLAIFQITNEDPYPLYAPIFENAKNIYAELSVSMPILDKLNIYSLIRYDNYDMEEIEKAWYIPSTKVQLGGKYGLLDGRLNLGLEFSYLSAVPHPENEFEVPNAVFDVNLNGEYLFTENFGAFIQFNNLADSRYIRWQNYQGLGINVLGGLSIRFK